MLKFSRGNAKLNKLEKITGKKVYTFSLLSGWSCPYAKECLSKAVKPPHGNAKIQDGPQTQFRCYSASNEVQFPATYRQRKHNTDLVNSLRGYKQLANLIEQSLPPDVDGNIVRLHVGGDFNKQRYFDAWLQVAKKHLDTIFYGYTKALPFWVKRKKEIPQNFILTASRGGHADKLISQHRLREAVVVFSEEQAEELKLEIDHTDKHAALPEYKEQNFALLIHGQQPKGTEASKAVQKLQGKGSYSRR